MIEYDVDKNLFYFLPDADGAYNIYQCADVVGCEWKFILKACAEGQLSYFGPSGLKNPDYSVLYKNKISIRIFPHELQHYKIRRHEERLGVLKELAKLGV